LEIYCFKITVKLYISMLQSLLFLVYFCQRFSLWSKCRAPSSTSCVQQSEICLVRWVFYACWHSWWPTENKRTTPADSEKCRGISHLCLNRHFRDQHTQLFYGACFQFLVLGEKKCRTFSVTEHKIKYCGGRAANTERIKIAFPRLRVKFQFI